MTRKIRAIIVSACLVASAAFAGVVATTTGADAVDKTLPVKAAFYYPWFPETENWGTQYTPSLGKYDSSNRAILASHVAAAKYAGLDAFISSYWGAGTKTAQRLPLLLDAAAAQGLGVAAYYEPEGTANPTVDTISTDLAAIPKDHPGYLHVGGKPVLFVYNANDATCAIVDKWRAAAPGWYLSLKVFSGYASCATQPDSWHQYGPSTAYSTHGSYHANVSPGFYKFNETTPRLVRDLDRFRADVSRMADAAVSWKLVTSFNEWGEGTAVEAAEQWQSSSGYGNYLDALHAVFVEGKRFGTLTPTPTPTTTTPAPTTSPTTTPAPTTTTTPTPTTTTSPPPSQGDVVVAAAGDVACDPASGATAAAGNGTTSCAHNRVAQTIEGINPAAVLVLGDIQYENGALDKFQQSYDPTWGRFKARTYPAPGNHEWGTANAQGYRDYFGSGVPPEVVTQGRTWYSFDKGGWHFISLDSDCSKVGGCGAGSPQGDWYRADLAANDGEPTIVYWHHPRWSSGQHGNNSSSVPLWDVAVADRDVQMVLTGHDHDYERFAPMGPAGPSATGLREFVVGTGGKNHYGFTTAQAGSEVRNSNTYGALELTLRPDGSWAWQFIPSVGTGTFTDSGSQTHR